MAEIKNTFLQGRMNQDIDARLIPQGEYRAAVNLLISRSEGATVGEFENILGNSELSSTVKGLLSNIIGVHVDDINNLIYTFNTNFPLPAQTSERADNTNDCYIQRLDLNTNTSSIIVDGYWLNFSRQKPINQTNLVEDLLFWTDDFNQPRRINVTSAFNSPSYYFRESQISVARYYPYEALIPMERQTVTVSNPKGASSDTEIFITAGNDKIRYGDIVTANDKTEPTTSIIQNSIPPVRVVKVVNNTEFKVWPPIQPGALPDGAVIDFSRTTMENRADKYEPNFSIQEITEVWDGANPLNPDQILIDDWEMGGFPRIGDLVRIVTNIGGSVVPDNLRIKNIEFILGDNTPPSKPDFSRYTLTLSEDVQNGAPAILQVGDIISIANNETYDTSFDGDTKYLDDKFVRFSYRFRFVENEYSLIAPFSQIMFIPKQKGEFNLGQTNTLTQAPSNTFQSTGKTEIYNYYQDETDAYTSTILEWFENNVDSIELKIPLPTLTSSTKSNIIQQIQERFQINSIDILYKESDAESIKVLDTLDLSLQNEDKIETILYDDDINGLTTKLYLKYSYTSNKPYKTLPEDQTTRVYDKVPIKALSQELISNRIVYGNYLQGMTPPESIEYTANWSPRDAQTSDYTTQYPYSNVKQNRTYQVGFVLADYYGRQSDVILSTLDQVEEFKGSTVYVPYRSAGDAIDEPVIDWLGRNLTLDISEEIATEINPSQGKPGIYKEDGNVVTLSVNDPGEDFIVNKTYSTLSSLNGSGLTIRVTEVDAVSGEILAFIIATSGANYEVGEIITIASPVFGSPNAILQVDEVGVANPLGWYTYKVVVKQQEQEYYNVFLPGFVNGLPICNQVWDGVDNQTSSSPPTSTCSKVDSIQTERGKIAFATLLSENVNKIPRSLDEVGPTDLEFNSDEILFIRVNNPNVLGVTGDDTSVYDQIDAVNKQYYPNQLQQNVLTIETVRDSELQAVPFKKFRRSPNRAIWPYVTDGVTNHAVPCTHGVAAVGAQEYTQKSGFKGEYNSNVLVADTCRVESGGGGTPIVYSGNVFSVSSGSIPWGDVGDTAPFYGADQNPFIMKIGQVTNYENPIGAIVAGPPLQNQGCAAPNNIIPHDSNWPTEDGEGLRSMRPILSIAETKPVFSLLDIFWESTLSGKLEVLNSSISSNYNGVVSCSISEVEFPEDAVSGDIISSSFNFINGSGASATVSNVSIVSLYTEQSPNVQLVPNDYFTVVPSATPNEFEFETTKEYWYRQDSIASGADVYIASLQVESSSGAETFTDILTDAITIRLENEAPQIYSDNGYTDNVTGTTITIPSVDYPDTPPVTISEILTLWGLNGSVDSANYKKQILWEVEGPLGTPTTDFELIAGPDEGSIILKNTVEVTPEVPYSLTIKATDANDGVGALTSEVTVVITFGTQPAPKPISTPPSNWATPSTCPAKYTSSHYPAFGGLMKSGEFRFTRTDSTYIIQDCAGSSIQTILPGATLPSVAVPYYCFNVCGGTTSSIYANGGGFDDVTPGLGGCPVTEKGRGDLFQGTLDLKIFTEKVSTNVSAGDVPTTRFVIQYRANSGDAWSYIDSVPVSKAADPNASDEIYDSTTPIVILGPSKLANDPQCTKIGVRYKFDQLGEYRVVCSTTGPRSEDWGWFIEYADGTYSSISDACEPS